MSDIKIVTDSTAYLPLDYVLKNDIEVVPLTVHFEGETKPEGFPGQFEAFFKRLSQSTEFPRTSQPSVDAFAACFENALQKGKEVLAVLLSSGVSGTYQSAVLAANMVDKERISIIDSNTGCSAVHILVDNAIDRIKNGLSRFEVAESLKRDIGRIRFFCTCTSLEYLRRGGRLSSISSFVGSVLNIKPVILVDNVMKTFGKARGINKALNTIIGQIPDTVKRIKVSHILSQQTAEALIEKLRGLFPGTMIEMDELGAVVGSHLGPGGIGICFEDAEKT